MNKPPTKEDIFNEYYKPYEVTVSYRSAENELNSLLNQAFKAYKNEEFSKALGLFQQVLNQREDVAARMYSGISYIEIDKYHKANKSFRKVVNNEDNLFVDQAKWYMSICYVRIGDLSKAKNLLRDLQTTSQHYSSKSKEVIEKLEKAKE
jgi:tetratricopeptide (TPR) repeat protein